MATARVTKSINNNAVESCNDYLAREYTTGEIPAWKYHPLRKQMKI